MKEAFKLNLFPFFLLCPLCQKINIIFLVMDINVLTSIVIELCIKIHSKIGPGCFERVYEEILYYELTKLGFKVERQVMLPIVYEDLKIDNAYKLDLLVVAMTQNGRFSACVTSKTASDASSHLICAGPTSLGLDGLVLMLAMIFIALH